MPVLGKGCLRCTVFCYNCYCVVSWMNLAHSVRLLCRRDVLRHYFILSMITSALRLCTWNVNGVHTPVKRKKILTYLKRECVDIASLQETHLNDSEHLKLQQGGFGQFYFSSFTSRSRGVAILIQGNLPFKLVDCSKDMTGCYVIVRGILYGEEIAIMNIYNQPGYPSDLLTTSFSKVIDLNIRNTFIGGDFNCHLNPTVDKFPPGKSSLSPQAKVFPHFARTLTI